MQEFARRHIPNKIYFLGPAGVGKTTLAEGLQERRDVLNLPYDLLHTRKSRSTVFHEHRSGFEYDSLDTGGEGDVFHRGYLAIRDEPPLGIIFVVDHRNSQIAKQRLQTLLGVLTDNKTDRPSKAITRGIMVFINKYDLWKHTKKPRNIVKPFKNELKGIKHLGIYLIVRWGSAKYYKKFPTLLDTATTDFHKLLTSMNPKVPEWPSR